MQIERTAIPKKIRFEVFKRDSFKCQYCGESAPNVLLHVDHIDPVANGGSNDIFNLTTSCQPCNSGKGKTLLSDQNVLAKSKSQLDLLQERKEQIDMMFEWHGSLKNLKDETLDKVCDYWNNLTKHYTINVTGREDLSKLLEKYSLDEVLNAINIASKTYFKSSNGSKFDKESIEIAFSKLQGIIVNKRKDSADPEFKEILYIKGIIKNKCGYFENDQALRRLNHIRQLGEPVSEIKKMALALRCWTQFSDWYLDKQREYLGEGADVHY